MAGYLKNKLDIIVFTDVMVTADQLKKQIGNSKFNCESFKNLKVKLPNIVVCRNPNLRKISRGNGLPEDELKNNRIDVLRLASERKLLPGFHAIYEFKDGFRFYLVGVDLISGDPNQDLREEQIESLANYIDSSPFINLPVVIIGNWKNRPKRLEEASTAPREIDRRLMQLKSIFPDIALVESNMPRTKVFDGDSGLPKKYNNLFFSQNIWTVKQVNSNDVCADLDPEDQEDENKMRRHYERKRNYVDGYSTYCTVFFDLTRNGS